MKENKFMHDKVKNKLLPIVIIVCAVALIAIFVIYKTSKGNEPITLNKAEIILKEKNEFYKKIIEPEPYCGDNASRTSDKFDLDEKVILYWNVSTQFKSYNQLLDYISDNMTKKQIQKLKLYDSYPTFKENLYLEKDNKLYCGVVGAGSVNPNNTTYEVTEYTDNKIIGTATDIYGADTVDLGLINRGQYKYNIVLVKENGLWKIDEYEGANIGDDSIYEVTYNHLTEETFGSEELGKKYVFKVSNGYLTAIDINNNNYKLESISNIKNILLLTPTSIDNTHLFILTKDGKVYVVDNIYNLNSLEDISNNITEISFDGQVEDMGYTKDFVSPPISKYLVLKTNYGEYLFNSSSYDKYILINNSEYDKVYNVGDIIITLKNNSLSIRDINLKKLIDDNITVSSIDDISRIGYHEYLSDNSSELQEDKNIIDIYLYCKESSCDSAFTVYQYNIANKTLSIYNENK